MKKVLATVLALALCVSACSAFAETKVSFFTGKIETVDLLNEIIDLAEAIFLSTAGLFGKSSMLKAQAKAAKTIEQLQAIVW